MSVELHEERDNKLLVVRLSGKLIRQDYEYFTPEVERLIKQLGATRMLVELHDFEGWSRGRCEKTTNST